MSTLQSDHPLGAHPGPGRAETRERLSKAAYDLLVIGGGILGTAVAWHSAQSGLRVAMVDAGDFTGATSSASSKLAHGGLRYLQTGAVKLVAENLHERRVPAKDVAPHLVNPLTFYLPVYKGGPHSAAKLGAGVFAYSMLSAFGDGVGRLISPAGAAADHPGLRTDGLKAVAVYGDHQATPIDKYRLTFALPWEDQLLLGTTEEAYEGDPAEVRTTGADIQQIVDEAALSVRDEHLSHDLTTYAFAGLRALPGGPGGVESAQRETVVTEGRGGMLPVAGGKWTTYRHIGRTVLRKVAQLHRSLSGDMKPVSHPPRRVPLPGLADPNEVAHRLLVHREAGARMDPLTGRHLATPTGRCPSTSPTWSARTRPWASGSTPMARRSGHRSSMRDHEWAEAVDDVLRRRTTLAVRGLGTDEVRAGVQDLLVQKD